MKLIPANIVCPACGNANYMRHLIGKDVGHFDLKCINCNSYFNFDELYNRRIGAALKPKPLTNADRIRTMSDEEMAEYLDGMCHDLWQMFVKDSKKMWLDWLKQEVDDDRTRIQT